MTYTSGNNYCGGKQTEHEREKPSGKALRLHLGSKVLLLWQMHPGEDWPSLLLLPCPISPELDSGLSCLLHLVTWMSWVTLNSTRLNVNLAICSLFLLPLPQLDSANCCQPSPSHTHTLSVSLHIFLLFIFISQILLKLLCVILNLRPIPISPKAQDLTANFLPLNKVIVWLKRKSRLKVGTVHFPASAGKAVLFFLLFRNSTFESPFLLSGGGMCKCYSWLQCLTPRAGLPVDVNAIYGKSS